ncbi:nucleoid-associated protein [Sporomusaceae bacterium FL31]|nr:nucleoid-associated protein [Sporomusaceae bacterium FL31]GCE35781.1 nucleoid-associated protein [Sporomusaceae bacterium]
MFENLGNMMEMVKKVQQNVQSIQEQLRNERIEVSSGDVIKVVVNGQQDVVALELNGKYLSPDNAALLQDLLVATLNNAMSKSRDLNQTAMNKITTDLNLPKIPGLF